MMGDQCIYTANTNQSFFPGYMFILNYWSFNSAFLKLIIVNRNCISCPHLSAYPCSGPHHEAIDMACCSEILQGAVY